MRQCYQTIILLLLIPVVAYPNEIELSIKPIDIPYSISQSASTNFLEGSQVQADFFACIQNTGTNSMRLYEEWNSWGYGQLKLVCFNGWREYWLIKQPGRWSRNFPSSVLLKPGELYKIPVAFDPSIWQGIASAMKDNQISHIRIVYDQILTPTNSPPLVTEIHWSGIASSRYYPLRDILGGRGKTRSRHSSIEFQEPSGVENGTAAGSE